jgi:iron complex outermembrane recepter protein
MPHLCDRTTLYTLLCALFAAPLTADPTDPLLWDESDFFADIAPVIAVTRLPQRRQELPASVSVINRHEIRASGAREIAELFRLVPGFQVGHYHDIDGSKSVVTYHGNSDQYSRRLQVMIDGRSVYLPASGGVRWNQLPISIDDIERIEIVRGPNGAGHGLNAFQGSIHITTRHDLHSGSEVTVAGGDQAYGRFHLRNHGQLGDLNWWFTVEGERHNGFDPCQCRAGIGPFSANDDVKSQRLNLSTRYRLDVNDYLDISLGGLKSTQRVGNEGLPYNPTERLHDQQIRDHYQQISWHHQVSNDNEFTLSLHQSHNNTYDTFHTFPLSDLFSYYQEMPITPEMIKLFLKIDDQPIFIDHSLLNRRQGAEFNHQYRLNPTLRLAWGVEWRQDRVRGGSYFDRSDWLIDTINRQFANLEWRPRDQWLINLGNMREVSDNAGTLHAPRLSITRLFPAGHYLRLGQSEAWRSPVAMERHARYSLYLSQPHQLIWQSYTPWQALKPEHIVNRELAVGGEMSTPQLQWELRLFNEEISDIITASRDEDPAANAYHSLPGVRDNPYRQYNNGHSRLRGAEIELVWRHNHGHATRLALSHIIASGQRLWAYTPSDPASAIYQDMVDYVPERTLNLLQIIAIPDFALLGLNYSKVSGFRWAAGDRVNYSTLNITLQREIQSIDTSLWFAGRHLLGEFYSFEEETISKRQWQAGITTRF